MSKPFGADKWMKKAKPFGYFRISTEEQSVQDEKTKEAVKKTTIKRQIKEVQDELKRQGLPAIKKENIFAEVASGTKTDRSQWLALRSEAMAHDGPAFIVVKSPSRWARNVEDAVEAWAPLKRRGVPVFAISDNIQTGTAKDRRPQESLWFLMNQGFAAQFSLEQAEKADKGVARQESEGALGGTGSSIYPFARQDPMKVLLENEFLLSEPKGATKLNSTIETLTMPNGMKSQSVSSLRTKLKTLREKLTPEQFEEWLEFREYLRLKLLDLDSDPWVGKLDISSGSKVNFYPARALMRMSGLYLGRPWEFPKPEVRFLDNVLKNFTDFLSDKDKKRRGKR
jgi:DNA invertase Pin-like site-specific DNA recombinase